MLRAVLHAGSLGVVERGDQPLTARHKGWVDKGAWTQLILDHFARKGHATQQRLRTDPVSSPSLR